MDRCSMKKIAQCWVPIVLSFAFTSFSEENSAMPSEKERPKIVQTKISIPYERPIGFTLNLGAISSMTFEGRFLLGIAPNLSLVVSPSYQNTPELPFYHLRREEMAFFDVRRFNMGVGIRGHFYEYDSWDGWFIEGMGRGGMTSIGHEDYMWSVTPSLIFGYSAVYDSGYTASFGLGFDWEFLLGKNPQKDYHTDYLKTAYFGITKIPITGELAIGWMW